MVLCGKHIKMQITNIGLVLLALFSYLDICYGKAVIEESPNHYRGYEYTYNFKNNEHRYRPLYDAYLIPTTEAKGSDTQAPRHSKPLVYPETYDDEHKILKEAYKEQNYNSGAGMVEPSAQVLPSLQPTATSNRYGDSDTPTFERLKETHKNRAYCTNCHELPVEEEKLSPPIIKRVKSKTKHKPTKIQESHVQDSQKCDKDKYECSLPTSEYEETKNAASVGYSPYIKVIKRKKHTGQTSIKKQNFEENGEYLPTIKNTPKVKPILKQDSDTKYEYSLKTEHGDLKPVSIKIKNKKARPTQEVKKNIESYTINEGREFSETNNGVWEHEIDYHDEHEEDSFDEAEHVDDVVVIRPKMNEESKSKGKECVQGKTKNDKDDICFTEVDDVEKISKPNTVKIEDQSSEKYGENGEVSQPSKRKNKKGFPKDESSSNEKPNDTKYFHEDEKNEETDCKQIDDNQDVIHPKSKKGSKDKEKKCCGKDCIEKNKPEVSKPNTIKSKDVETKLKGTSFVNYENYEQTESEYVSDAPNDKIKFKHSPAEDGLKDNHDFAGDDRTNYDNFSDSEDFRRLPFLNTNIWSLLFNPEAKDHKLKPCLTRSNESGNCMYVQQCQVPNMATSLEQLINNACVVDDVFIGVCCPEFPVETVKVHWDDIEVNSFDKKMEDVFDPNHNDCGTRAKEAFAIQKWPWKAQLVSMANGKVFCGGAVIRDEYILTAAHCTTKIPKNQILVRLGQHDISSGEDFVVTEIKRHAQYNSRNLQNDIALLKLGRRIPHTDNVNVVCMPDADEDDYSGEKATLLGWRGDFVDNQKPERLEVLSHSECSKLMNSNVPHSVLCTEARNEDETTCNADSGAPLVIEDDDQYEVIGILSWNRNDCDKRFPSIFSKVSSYVKWIQRHAL